MNWIKLLAYPTIMAVLLGAVLFGAAGRTDVLAFWLYLAIWLVFTTFALMTADEDLMRERRQPGGPSCDNLRLLRLMAFLCISSFLVIAGLDQRFGWTGTIHPVLQAAGFLVMIAATAFANWATRVNRFFSSAVRIQADRGHTVVTTGPYEIIRHPGYAGFMILMIAGSIALGSLWSLVPALVWSVLFIRRAAIEDGMLRSNLDGYEDYARRVRFRLIPRVW